MNRFFFRVLNRLNLLPFLNLTGLVTLNRKTFKVPVKGGIGYNNMWMSEVWMIELLKIVTPISKGVFVDVGVNVGQTLLKVKSVLTEIEYVGFEPNSTCVQYVNDLVTINKFENTTIVPVGISTKTALCKLFFYGNSTVDSSASIVENFRPGEQIKGTEFIPVFNMAVIKQSLTLNKVGIIKIDVEGCELEVLTELEDNIVADQPIILIEILPVYKANNIERLQRQKKIEKLFVKWGYSILRIVKENEELKNTIEINEIGIHGDIDNCEYAIIPNAIKDRFVHSFAI